MYSWQQEPLGFVLVDETRRGQLAIHHVSISSESGVSFTGAWHFSNPEPMVVRTLMTQRIIVGTADGISLTQSLLGDDVGSAELSGLVDACEATQAELQTSWETYRDGELRAHANLKPLKAPTWPKIGKDGDAATILRRVGKAAYPATTPTLMRDIIALANLLRYVMEAWFELETDRISRAYLHGGDDVRRLYPPAWLAVYGPYWPGGE